MAPRISLALASHNHQPVGNFGWVFADVYEQAYRPMLDALERHHSRAAGCGDQHRTITSAQRRRMMSRAAVFVAALAVFACAWFGISRFAADGDGASAFARTFEEIEKARHGLVVKIRKTHRYRLTHKGQLVTAALFATRRASIRQLLTAA